MNKLGTARGIIVAAALATLLGGGFLYGELLEYEITALNPLTWVLSAKEVATGDIVQFRLHPSAFKGQTFDADLTGVGPGHALKIHAPKNAVLGDAILEKPTGRGAGHGRGRLMRQVPSAPSRLAWEIIEVNAAELTMTARNRGNRTIVFRVDPTSFIGYRFKADLSGIEKGGKFTIVAPNLEPLSKNCVLVE